MGEWFGQHVWAIWLVAAMVLGTAELMTLDLILLMLGIGALAGMVTAFVVPGMLVIQAVVAVIAAVLSMFVLRPPLLASVRSAKGYRSSLDRVLGSTGISTEAITATSGAARIDGDVWTARAYDPETTIAPGEEVEVIELDGVTVRVHPRHTPLGP